MGGALLFQHRLDRNIERLGNPFSGLTERPVRPSATVPPTSQVEASHGTAPVNLLVVGSDSRISAGEPAEWSFGAQRTDAIMLVHLPGDRQAAHVVSIPRDSWVPIPGHRDAKINAAFSWGGPPLLIATVEQLTGVLVDHFVVTDFESFRAMTDALGGVEIVISDDWHDSRLGPFPAGAHLLSGDEALSFVRTRRGLPGGDFDRVQRHQSWMRAILKSVAQNPSDITRVATFLDTISQSIAADDGLTMGRMRELFFESTSIRPADVTFITAPHSGTGRSHDGQSIVLLDHALFDLLMKAIATDDATEFVRQNSHSLTILGPSAR